MKYKLNSLQILAAGFALVILAGAALLCLPFATRQGISFFDALFISTSATCVTGLVVCDTFTTFTLFGQAVILALIQVGGLGFMMVAILFWIALGRREASSGLPAGYSSAPPSLRAWGPFCWPAGSAPSSAWPPGSGTGCSTRYPPSATPALT